MEEQSATRRVLVAAVEGRRQRSRSKLRWEDGVVEEARKLGERNWRNAARNRDSWQKLLKKGLAQNGLLYQLLLLLLLLLFSSCPFLAFLYQRAPFICRLNAHSSVSTNIKVSFSGMFRYVCTIFKQKIMPILKNRLLLRSCYV